ncbi:Nitroreductase family protein [Hyphomicrobium sulfonivorans]|uniref:Putative NAD(P)H nitroreductase n=1 Tax=Hyphomicrobium sulfonivorans TaxID=121290 RepID=A0A109BA35_HYPSL|nr:nitroreductase [Hyphomicrobium sulfonivorans]KWT64973.1 Nitroreductase family protein [Hyphomicrobium sulfonivorans]
MENPVIDFLSKRRSVKPDRLQAPAPTAQELETIFTIASRVPDHKKLAPWRFIVIEGDARAKLGEAIAEACVAAEQEPPSHVRLETERNRLQRAPMVIAAISRVTPHRSAPEWEQVLSAGAACLNLCIAANALGYGTAWLSEWIAYNADVAKALGLGENERVAGFIYIGTPMEAPTERERPALTDIVSRWGE